MTSRIQGHVTRDFPVGVLAAHARAWLDGEAPPPVPAKPAATVMLVRDRAGEHGGEPRVQGGGEPRVQGSVDDGGEPGVQGAGEPRGEGGGEPPVQGGVEGGGEPSVEGAGEPGVEIFVLRRVATMEFAPRMMVFPGGGVDPRDADPDLPWAGPPPQTWATTFGTDEAMARELVVAAVREVFEECGVLLAGPSAESVVADVTGTTWRGERAALLGRETSLAQLLIRRGLVLRADLLSARAHWITPEFEAKRYDTKFFAALLPPGQIADDQTSEADHAAWTDPRSLLADHASGAALMLPPTVVSVEQVAAATSAADFLAERPAVAPVMPVLLRTDAGLVIRCELPV